jgi:hypothetical protein
VKVARDTQAVIAGLAHCAYSSLICSLCVSPILASKGYGLTYGAPNLFKQSSKPFPEPHISELASGSVAIHPAFVLG